MKVETKFKYVAVTPEGEILTKLKNNTFTSKGMFSKKEAAESNLKEWIRAARYKEKYFNSKAFGESHPKSSDFYLRQAESFKKQAEAFEACQVAKIKITLEIVA